MLSYNLLSISLINKNFLVLYLFFLIQMYNFIIFFNYHNNHLSNKALLDLKNEISKEGCISLNLHRSAIKNIFTKSFGFIYNSILAIFIINYETFIKICNLLQKFNIKYFFSYKKVFSTIFQKEIVFEDFFSKDCLNYKFNFVVLIFITLFFNFSKKQDVWAF